MALGAKDCWRCGATFERTNWHQKACRPCGRAVAKEKEKARAAAHARAAGKRVIGDPMTCGLCAKPIIRTGRNQLYCAPCSAEKIRLDTIAARERHAAKRAEYQRRPDVRDRKNATSRSRTKTDPVYAMEKRVRASVRQALKFAIRRGEAEKRGAKAGSTLDRMPWTTPELLAHLERQFLPGMTWANMGEWHVDHVQPLSSFRITGLDCPELRAAWSLSNLRPLWARDNLTKSARRLLLV